ncbi:MAG: WD40 repeat domain-containing protein, partial [Deltaproteobacteria bacterium]
MTAPMGPFRVEPQPGEAFALPAREPLAAQWSSLLERLPPRASTFAVRDERGDVVLLGARPVEPLTDDADVTAIAFDPSGSWLATGHEDGGVRLWDAASPDPIWSRDPADEPIEGLAFVDQGPWVLAWCEDGPLLIIARESGELVTRIEDPQFASFVLAVSPRGDEVALTGRSVMRIALPGGEMRAMLDAGLENADSSVLWVDYLADASMLVGVRASASPDGGDSVVFWNAEEGTRVGAIDGLRGVCACDLSPDRRLAAVATSDGDHARLYLVDTALRSVVREVALPHTG